MVSITYLRLTCMCLINNVLPPWTALDCKQFVVAVSAVSGWKLSARQAEISLMLTN